MKFKNYLIEQTKDNANIKIIVDYLHMHCSEYVNILKSNNDAILWRGLNTPVRGKSIIPDAPSAALEIDTPTDRKPLSNYHFRQKFIPKVINIVANVPLDHRKKSIYCATERYIASSYGNNIYMVVPHDGWSCIGFDGKSDTLSLLNFYHGFYKIVQKPILTELIQSPLYNKTNILLSEIEFFLEGVFADSYNMKEYSMSSFGKDLTHDIEDMVNKMSSVQDIYNTMNELITMIIDRVLTVIREKLISIRKQKKSDFNFSSLPSSMYSFITSYIQHGISKNKRFDDINIALKDIDTIESKIKEHLPALFELNDKKLNKILNSIVNKNNLKDVFSNGECEIALYNMDKSLIIHESLISKVIDSL